MQANGDIAGWVGRRVTVHDPAGSMAPCAGILRAGGLSTWSEVPFHIEGDLTGDWAPLATIPGAVVPLCLAREDIITLADEED